MSCDDELDDDPLHSEDGSEAETSRHTTLMETLSEKPTASSIAHCKSLASARAIYAAVQREMFEECESLNQGFQQKPLSSSTANGLQSKSCGGGTTQSESIFGSVSVADPYPYSTSMQQARRAVIEGGTMSEDRFLELQAEVFRLRREATQRDEMHKLLTARLCRAEEAARRKMRDNLQQNLKPCKQKTDAIAAITQQYWAEQRIHELEENLRERHREVQRALENSRVYKSEIQGLKRRLEVTIRASRSEKPLCFRDRQFERDLRNQVSKLQEENHKLQFQIASLVQLPAADLQQLQTLEVPPLAGGPPHEVRDATDKSMVSSNPVVQSLKDDETEECLLKQNLEGAKGPSAQFVTTQMLETWQRLETLKKRKGEKHYNWKQQRGA
ncbi:unnamed protein product [Sphagnum jensenii]|uniref:Uncharacterized protein n=1 Tax=Sphagnum jensenii TaxID=128206 RepID=A0ABP0VXJ1_9BRYO